nr:EamA family transporter [Streptomyces roseolilacinus]
MPPVLRPRPPPRTRGPLGAYMAPVPVFAGYVLFGWGLAHVPAGTATTLSLLEPAVAAVLAVLVVGERLPAVGWVGIALVVGCLAVLTAPIPSARRPRRREGRTAPAPGGTAPPHEGTTPAPVGRRRRTGRRLPATATGGKRPPTA